MPVIVNIRFSIRNVALLLWFAILMVLPRASTAANLSEQPETIRLTNWEYLTDSAAAYTIQEVGQLVGWHPLPASAEKPQTLNCRVLWCRTRLPEWDGKNPTVYLGQVKNAIQVFLNDTMIYELGDSASHQVFIAWNQNMIPLPYFQAGDYLIVKMYIRDSFLKMENKALLGSSGTLLRYVFRRDIPGLFFAVLFLVSGVVLLLVGIYIFHMTILSWIGISLVTVAAFILSNSLFLQIMLPHPALYYYFDFLSMLSYPVYAFNIIGQIIEKRYRSAVRFIVWIHLGVCVVMTALILGGIVLYDNILAYYLSLFSVNIIICTVLMFISARNGDHSNRALIVGFFGFIVASLVEIYLYFGRQELCDFGYSVRALYFGVLVFMASLVWIAVDKYKKMDQMREAARRQELNAIKREKEIQQQFSRQLLESQENERNRIAQELHDSVGQKLLLIKNQLTAGIRQEPEGNLSGQLQRMNNLTGDTIQEIRSISYNLRPPHLDQLGLTTALETLVETVQASSDIRFNLLCDPIDGLIPLEYEINFFRIVQEGLNNIIKHAGATEASVTIKHTNDKLDLEIRDNGSGFRESMSGNAAGMGLTGMQERARMFGAILTITPAEPSGTLIHLEYYLVQG